MSTSDRPVAEVIRAMLDTRNECGERLYKPIDGKCVAVADARFKGLITETEYKQTTLEIAEYMDRLEETEGYKGVHLDDYRPTHVCYSIYQNWERRHDYLIG